jgi:hypothetical protein
MTTAKLASLSIVLGLGASFVAVFVLTPWTVFGALGLLGFGLGMMVRR